MSRGSIEPEDRSVNMASQQPSVPVYDIPQPDGNAVAIDLTTPGSHGDFAFSVHVPRGAPGRFSA